MAKAQVQRFRFAAPRPVWWLLAPLGIRPATTWRAGRWIRHPGLTVTVSDPDALVEALRRPVPAATSRHAGNVAGTTRQ